MADRNLKAQLGARVPQNVRQQAVDAAAQADVSLNEWVERAIVSQATAEGVSGQPPVIAGQTTLDDPEERLLRGEFVDEVFKVDGKGLAEFIHTNVASAEGQLTPELLEKAARIPDDQKIRIDKVDISFPPDADTINFSPSCSNKTYHWRHSPTNPCRYCGGTQ